METKYISLLIAITFLIGCSHEQQDLCGTVTTVLHVADPSHCARYLYCHRDSATDEVISVHQLDCRAQSDTFQFFTAGECRDVSTGCPATCPVVGMEETFVGVEPDDTCQWHFPCGFPTLLLRCSGDLLFNRHNGLCVDASEAPCPGEIISPPSCPEHFPPVSGQFPGSRCYDWILCVNGDIVQRGNCAPGQRFVPHENPLESGACQPDPTCVQTTTRMPTMKIPLAPLKSAIRHPKSLFIEKN